MNPALGHLSLMLGCTVPWTFKIAGVQLGAPTESPLALHSLGVLSPTLWERIHNVRLMVPCNSTAACGGAPQSPAAWFDLKRCLIQTARDRKAPPSPAASARRPFKWASAAGVGGLCLISHYTYQITLNQRIQRGIGKAPSSPAAHSGCLFKGAFPTADGESSPIPRCLCCVHLYTSVVGYGRSSLIPNFVSSILYPVRWAEGIFVHDPRWTLGFSTRQPRSWFGPWLPLVWSSESGRGGLWARPHSCPMPWCSPGPAPSICHLKERYMPRGCSTRLFKAPNTSEPTSSHSNAQFRAPYKPTIKMFHIF